jgi:hypothetical protein
MTDRSVVRARFASVHQTDSTSPDSPGYCNRQPATWWNRRLRAFGCEIEADAPTVTIPGRPTPTMGPE